jgi:hypothetical protein
MLDEGASKPTPASLDLTLVHSTKQRARLKIEQPAAIEVLTDLANQIASIPGVLQAHIRPNTGSVILISQGSVTEILDEVKERGIALIRKSPPKPPVNQVLQMGLLQADIGLKKRTGEAIDLRTLIALGLLGAAIVQLSRGRVAGPATTLALGALSLIDKKSER